MAPLRRQPGRQFVEAVERHHLHAAVQRPGRNYRRPVAVDQAPAVIRVAQDLHAGIVESGPFQAAAPLRDLGRLRQSGLRPREFCGELLQAGGQSLGEFQWRHLAAALDIEGLRRVAALLLVPHQVVRRQPRDGRRAASAQGGTADHAEAQLVAMRQEAHPGRQLRLQLAQRGVAAIGQHGVGLAPDGAGRVEVLPLPPQHRDGSTQARLQPGQGLGEHGGEHRFAGRDLADIAGLGQQAADQAPQRQSRHVAGPDMGQQIRPLGMGPAAGHARLEAVEQRRVAQILDQEALQLQRAEGPQRGAQVDPDHFGRKAGARRQPAQQPLVFGRVRVEQLLDHAVDRLHDVAHRQRAQALAARAADLLAQRPQLVRRQRRHLEGMAGGQLRRRQLAPGQLPGVQPRQMADPEYLRLHVRAAATKDSTASEQPLAWAPSARPSSWKPSAPTMPTSSVRMLSTEL